MHREDMLFKELINIDYGLIFSYLDRKSLRDVEKLRYILGINIKKEINIIIKPIEPEVINIISKIEELKERVKRGEVVDPEEFKLSYSSFNEMGAAKELYLLVREKSKTLPLYEVARRNLVESAMSYLQREFWETVTKNASEVERRK